MEERPRGRFITLEGPDGSGKSSQAERLARWLEARGLVVTLTREPGGTALGEGVRTLLMAAGLDHLPRSDALLFNAARAQLVARVIRPALERGETVVCDRYADSTLAYQGAGGGVDAAELRRIIEFATGGLHPNLTILLDLPVAAGLDRKAGGPATGRTRFELDARHDLAFHTRVRDAFLALAAAAPERWRIVDAARDPDTVAGDVAAAVAGFFDPTQPDPARLRITS